MSNATAPRAALDRLFSPRSIAMVGASNTAGRIGATMFATLARYFEGELYPIHPTDTSIQGIRAYKRLADLPGPVDLAVIAVAADTAGNGSPCASRSLIPEKPRMDGFTKMM